MTALRDLFFATVVLLRGITNSNFTDIEEPNKSIFGTTYVLKSILIPYPYAIP